MSTIRGVKDRRFKFVQILNSMFEDQKLSLKAKGFIGYCLTKTEDWKFHISYLEKVLQEGQRAIYSTINECIEKGYAIRYQTRKENGDFGGWETVVSDSKEEIALIKKELEDSGEFKESFTHCCFADAQLADPQSVSDSNTIATEATRKQPQQQAAAVVVVQKDFCKSDAQRTALTKGWTPDEVDKAFEIYDKNRHLVSHPIEYIEGIIEKTRIINDAKQKKQGKLCSEKQSQHHETSQERQERARKKLLDLDMHPNTLETFVQSLTPRYKTSYGASL